MPVDVGLGPLPGARVRQPPGRPGPRCRRPGPPSPGRPPRAARRGSAAASARPRPSPPRGPAAGPRSSRRPAPGRQPRRASVRTVHGRGPPRCRRPRLTSSQYPGPPPTRPRLDATTSTAPEETQRGSTTGMSSPTRDDVTPRVYPLAGARSRPRAGFPRLIARDDQTADHPLPPPGTCGRGWRRRPRTAASRACRWPSAPGDELVLSAAVGVADAAAGTPLTTAHLFRVASHSKTFTATAVLQLVEAGGCGWTTRSASTCPSCGPARPWRRSPSRELLGPPVRRRPRRRARGLLAAAAAVPRPRRVLAEVPRGGVVHARNEHFKYSNVGYALVGLAIESVTGTPTPSTCGRRSSSRWGSPAPAPDHDPARAGEYAAGHTGLLLGAPTGGRCGTSRPGRWPRRPASTRPPRTSASSASAHFLGDDRPAHRRLEAADAAAGVGRDRRTAPRSAGTALGHGAADRRRAAARGPQRRLPRAHHLTLLDPVGGLVVSVLTNAVDGPAEDLAPGWSS